MPLTIGWGEIAVRLALSLLAGALIGLNRSEQRRPAGLRTTTLVCLAAAIAMIQTNILLPTAGKPPASFVVMDLMRLPLGILSGMGFIGAGAIIRRGNIVDGVTTAATLWFVTVMGLCFGGGQLALGTAALGLAAFVLWCLKWAERTLGFRRRASLTIGFDANSSVAQHVAAVLAAAGFAITAQSRSFRDADGHEIRYELSWRASGRSADMPEIPDSLAHQAGVRRLEWQAEID